MFLPRSAPEKAVKKSIAPFFQRNTRAQRFCAAQSSFQGYAPGQGFRTGFLRDFEGTIRFFAGIAKAAIRGICPIPKPGGIFWKSSGASHRSVGAAKQISRVGSDFLKRHIPCVRARHFVGKPLEDGERIYPPCESATKIWRGSKNRPPATPLFVCGHRLAHLWDTQTGAQKPGFGRCRMSARHIDTAV